MGVLASTGSGARGGTQASSWPERALRGGGAGRAGRPSLVSGVLLLAEPTPFEGVFALPLAAPLEVIVVEELPTATAHPPFATSLRELSTGALRIGADPERRNEGRGLVENNR